MKKLGLDPQPKVDAQLFEIYPAWMHDAIRHAHGTADDVYEARLSPDQLSTLAASQRKRFSGDWWVPTGFRAGIHWEHAPLESAGDYSSWDRHAFCWHITVSPPDVIDSMYNVLRDKRAAPHLIFGFRRGTVRPVVIQCIPFNLAGRALAHNSGPDTNRAGLNIQMEVCANVGDVPHFDDWGLYKAFANVVRVVNETIPTNITWDVPRSFRNTNRFGGQEYTQVDGHHGHIHVPGNDHVDPTTAFMGDTLTGRLKNLASGDYYDLSGVGP